MRFKPSEALRFLGGLAVAAFALGFVVLRVTSCAPAPGPGPVPAFVGPRPAPPPAAPTASCDTGPATAAHANTASLQTLAWAPFGRAEIGWQTYAPLVAREIHTSCKPDTPGFAAALAALEVGQRLAADGRMRATGEEPSASSFAISSPCCYWPRAASRSRICTAWWFQLPRLQSN